MPQITRTFIKSGMIWFLLALLAGLIMAFEPPWLPVILPLFWHMLMVGWITQIIMGVSLWMFPGRNREEGFRAQRKGWLAWGFLNAGLLLRVASEPFSGGDAAALFRLLLVCSALLHLAAGVAYAAEIWPRVQSREQLRKNRKKRRS